MPDVTAIELSMSGVFSVFKKMMKSEYEMNRCYVKKTSQILIKNK